MLNIPLSLWVLICDITRLSSLRGKATKFRSNKSKGLFFIENLHEIELWYVRDTIIIWSDWQRRSIFWSRRLSLGKTFTFSLQQGAFCPPSKNCFKTCISFRLFFLTIDSAFFTHWKTLAFTLSADDQLVSLIGGAFQQFLRFHWDVLCPSRTVLSIKNGKSDFRISCEPWSWP